MGCVIDALWQRLSTMEARSSISSCNRSFGTPKWHLKLTPSPTAEETRMCCTHFQITSGKTQVRSRRQSNPRANVSCSIDNKRANKPVDELASACPPSRHPKTAAFQPTGFGLQPFRIMCIAAVSLDTFGAPTWNSRNRLTASNGLRKPVVQCMGNCECGLPPRDIHVQAYCGPTRLA